MMSDEGDAYDDGVNNSLVSYEWGQLSLQKELGKVEDLMGSTLQRKQMANLPHEHSKEQKEKWR